MHHMILSHQNTLFVPGIFTRYRESAIERLKTVAGKRFGFLTQTLAARPLTRLAFT